jgi:hypothetical protein
LKSKLVWVIFKYPSLTSKKSQPIITTNIKRLMLFK